VATASSAYSVEAVFVSETDRYWATCDQLLVGSDGVPYVSPYDARGTVDSTPGYGIGPVCDQPLGCRLVGVAFSDRRDPVVAAVRLELADGSSATVPTTNGFFAVSAVEVLPDQASFDDRGLVRGTSGLSMIHQLTFLDESGTPIAGQVFDGTGSGPVGDGVAGLPGLDTYPSLARNP
jgi:hypothetical protein